jgi:hypothetical protein
MVLTFPRQPWGKRNRERDEWADFIREITFPSPEPDIPKVVPEPEKTPKKAGTSGSSGTGTASVPVQLKEIFRKKAGTPEASGSGDVNVPVQPKVMPPKKTGTPVPSGSVNASVPVQPKVATLRQTPNPKAKGRIHPSRKILEQVITPPAPSPEPVKRGKSLPPVKSTNCPQCGTQVPPSSLFCHRCGAKINESP